MRLQNSIMKCVDLLENFDPVPTIPNEKLKLWVARELRHLRETYMDAHGITSQKDFAEKAQLEWKSIYNLERGQSFPTLDTLNQILAACESNPAEFFARLIARSDLATIERTNKQEEDWIDYLVMGLSHPETAKVVQQTAEHIRRLLQLLEAR